MRGPDSPARHIGWHLAMIGTVACLLAPAALAVCGSFKPANTLYDADPLPTRPTLANYRVAITGFPIGQLIANTFAVAVGVMILQLAVAVLAAYAIVRFRTRAGGLLLLAGTAAILVPAQALLVPQFLILSHAGWLNSYAGLIVPQLSSVGVALLLLHQHIRDIPASLIEAAVLDGASNWRTLRHVVLPLLAPGPGRGRRPDLHQHVERVPVAADRHPGRIARHHPDRPGAVPQHRGREPRPLAGRRHLVRPAGAHRLPVHRPAGDRRLHARWQRLARRLYHGW